MTNIEDPAERDGGAAETENDDVRLLSPEDALAQERKRRQREIRCFLFVVAMLACILIGSIPHLVRGRSGRVHPGGDGNDGNGNTAAAEAELQMPVAWGDYCQAAFPGALPSMPYVPVVGARLMQVQVVTRHGDRTPANPLPAGDDATWDECPPPPLRAIFGAPASGGDAGSGGSADVTAAAAASLAASAATAALWVQPLGVADGPIAPPWAGGCSVGQLTARGASQMAALGRGLRETYTPLLFHSGGLAGPRDIYARATEVQRTQESAQALLGQLLLPSASSRSSSSCPSKAGNAGGSGGAGADYSSCGGPLELHVAQEGWLDILHPQPGRCPLLRTMELALFASDPWTDHLREDGSATLMAGLAAATGADGGRFPAWNESYDHFFDALRCRMCHGKALPCNPADPAVCVTQEQADAVFRQGNWEFRYRYTGYERALKTRLEAGPLFDAIVGNMIARMAQNGPLADCALLPVAPGGKDGDSSSAADDAPPQLPQIRNGTARPLVLLSTHDDMVGAVLGALNFTGWDWPPFASNIVFELWAVVDNSDDGESGDSGGGGGDVDGGGNGGEADGACPEYVVRVVYNGRVMPLPFCGEATATECPWRQFWAFARDALLWRAIEEECGVG